MTSEIRTDLLKQVGCQVKLNGKTSFTAKDQAKSDKANKFIGRGSPASSTAQYAKDWGSLANTGQYQSSDRVFISVEGARSGRLNPDFAEIQKAMDAGATLLTDDPTNRARGYNIGERDVAAYLANNGYNESQPGVWTPAEFVYPFLPE